MKKSLIIGLLWCLFSLGASVATANQYKNNEACGDIQGMLYYQKIPGSLLDWISSEIQLMDQRNSIHWKDAAGRVRKTFEFGFSFKEVEENQQVVRYDIPPFLVEARRQIVELFQDQLTEKDPEKYENCIITLYSEGDGIKPHTDRDYFGPDILGVIIVPDKSADPDRSSSSLYFTKDFEKPFFVSEDRGVAYLITGELRTLWKHQLDPVISERISIQFRTVDTEILDKHLNDIVQGK